MNTILKAGPVNNFQYVMENAESKDMRSLAALKLADRACRCEVKIDGIDLELLSESEIQKFINKAKKYIL